MERVRFGRFVLDGAAGVLLLEDGAEVALQPLVYKLLVRLIEQPGAVVSHGELTRHLWPDVHVTEASLMQAVRRLRVALGDPDIVRSVPRRGYRFVADVTPLGPAAPREPSLRLPPDAFVGRARELAEIARRIELGDRLITLTGPAGVGKTRLARTFAASRSGPVWFVSLQSAADEAELLREVARAVGAPDGSRTAEIGLRLSRHPGLLVLDDFEQLAPIAPRTLGVWQRAAPELVQVVTSRVVLGLRSERIVEVEPLPAADAAALFADRADLSADEPGVRELVEALDHLPLAIELAAARARLFAPTELLCSMRERFALLRSPTARLDGRHRSLRVAIDDSWDLLSGPERQALVELSTFRGPFDRDDASAVIAARGEPIDLLQALVDQSMVRVLPGGGRFALLPTIRAYVEERAEPDLLRPAEARHGRRLARLGEREQLRRAEDAPVRAALDDLVTACRRAIARGDADVARPTALAAWTVVRRTGPVSVGLELLQGADRLVVPRDTLVLARLGEALLRDHRLDEALEVRSTARDLCLARGDRAAAAVEAIGMTMVLRHLGRTAEARRLLHEAQQELAAAGDLYHQALVHQTLASIAGREGDGAAALEHIDAAIVLYRRIDSETGLASILVNRAIELAKRGRSSEAALSYDEAEAVLERQGNRAGLAHLWMNRAPDLAETGHAEEAVALSRRALEALREVGRPYDEALANGNLAEALAGLGRFEEAEAAVREELRIARALGSRHSEARSMATFAGIRRRAGALDEAEELAREAEALLLDGSPHLLAMARLERAEIQVARGEAHVALACLGLAEAVVRSRWNAFGTGQLLAVKAEALVAVGDHGAAEAALAEAEALTSALALAPTARVVQRISAARRAISARARPERDGVSRGRR